MARTRACRSFCQNLLPIKRANNKPTIDKSDSGAQTHI